VTKGKCRGISLSWPNNLNLVKYSGRRIVTIVFGGIQIGSQLVRSYIRIASQFPLSEVWWRRHVLSHTFRDVIVTNICRYYWCMICRSYVAPWHNLSRLD